MQAGGIFALGLLAATVLGVAAATGATRIDKGSDRPPRTLTEDGKSIWMTEWSACWRVKMSHISSVLHVRIESGMTPQQAAKKLANRAVFLLYETRPELVAAADGCRNGILWRYYHPTR
jgi:hypothetical protein